MKSKILVLFCLLTIACGSMQVQTTVSNFYENKTLDEVWGASLRAIVDMGFAVRQSEKTSGTIFATGGRNVMLQNEAPQLNILLREADGKVYVDCHSIQPGQLIDYGASKKNAKLFFEALVKYLK